MRKYCTSLELWNYLHTRDFGPWPIDHESPVRSYFDSYYRKDSIHAYYQKEYEKLVRCTDCGVSEGRNCANHILGYCFRGELEPLKMSFLGVSDGDEYDPRASLNEIQYYLRWEYYGNYSVYDAAFIVEKIKVGEGREEKKYYALQTTKRSALFRAEKKREYLKYGGTCLHWAAINGQFEIVKYLCEEHNVNVTLKVAAFDVTAKEIALANGHFNVYHYLNEWEKKSQCVDTQ